MQSTLDTLIAENRKLAELGRVATYIPELAKANPNALGVAVVTTDGQLYQSGDYEVRFTLQSVSKIFSLMLALEDRGFDGVFNRIGMEPTGDSFNSIVRLETFASLQPLNPMINAGAIATTALICGKNNEEKFRRLRDYIVALSGDESNITFNEAVYLSEKETGDRNRAIGYFLKDVHALEGDVDEVLDLYFRQCSLETDVRTLATIAARLAQGSEVDPPLPAEVLSIARTFMFTCGMYNASGEFAVKVGVPAKSGVSGCIMAVVPGRMGIAVIGPSLDSKGNSIAGVNLLSDLSRLHTLGIFND